MKIVYLFILFMSFMIDRIWIEQIQHHDALHAMLEQTVIEGHRQDRWLATPGDQRLVTRFRVFEQIACASTQIANREYFEWVHGFAAGRCAHKM